MKLPSRSESGTWDSDEIEVLSLLLQGDAWYLPKLRSHIFPPFCQGVERRVQDHICSVTIVYDQNVREEFALADDAWFGLPCLAVKDNRFLRPFEFHTGVYNGVLTGLSGSHPLASEWPRVVKIHDWCYIDFPWSWETADYSVKSWKPDFRAVRPPPMAPK